MKRDGTLSRDIGWGIAWGLGFAVFLSAIAMLQLAVGGTRAFDTNQTTYEEVVVLYVLGGSLGGVLVGLARPVLRTWYGAGLIGFVACIPIAVLLHVLDGGSLMDWSIEDTIWNAAWCASLGIPVGLIIWYRSRSSGGRG